MDAINIVICDDDFKSRDYYVSLIKKITLRNGINAQVTTYENGEQLLFAFEGAKVPPDVVYLDVYMPKTDGMEAARKLREAGYRGDIIFLTSSEDHALPAFDVHAFNYVVKEGTDYGSFRFEKVFLEATEDVRRRNRRYILLNGISEHCNVAVDSIRYFEVFKHVCVCHYDKRSTFEFVSSLSKLEDMLTQYGFVRIHRSFLVNSAYVERFTFGSATLADGTELPIGRHRYSALKEMIESLATVEINKAVDEKEGEDASD